MTGNNQININSTSSIGLRMSLQSGSINRGRGGATTGGVKRGSGKAGRGKVRPKKVQDEKKKKKSEAEFMAPLFEDKERGGVRNMTATPKDVTFNIATGIGRPHGNWQGKYSLVTVPDGRPVAASNAFTPLASVVNKSAECIIFLVMSYDIPTDKSEVSDHSSGDQLQSLLTKCRKSKFLCKFLCSCLVGKCYLSYFIVFSVTLTRSANYKATFV